jgi:hypothetical protein
VSGAKGNVRLLCALGRDATSPLALLPAPVEHSTGATSSRGTQVVHFCVSTKRYFEKHTRPGDGRAAALRVYNEYGGEVVTSRCFHCKAVLSTLDQLGKTKTRTQGNLQKTQQTRPSSKKRISGCAVLASLLRLAGWLMPWCVITQLCCAVCCCLHLCSCTPTTWLNMWHVC